jgi:hypothetical protein
MQDKAPIGTITITTTDGIIRNAAVKPSVSNPSSTQQDIFDHAPAKRSMWDMILGSKANGGKWELISWDSIKARLKLYFDTIYGDRNIDGGAPDSVYLPSQIIDGGTP